MLLPFRNQKLYRVGRWSADSSQPPEENTVEEVYSLEEANIVSSEQQKLSFSSDGASITDIRQDHIVILDIDVPAALLDSSTPGKHHLYIDAPMSWETYSKLLDVMAEAGILEPGYVAASKERGFTAVRLPWIRKGE